MGGEGHAGWQLQLLGPFGARLEGRLRIVPHSGARLLALAALVGPLGRSDAAVRLWPRVELSRAAANLRATLSRLNAVDVRLLDIAGEVISLPETVTTDVQDVIEWVNEAIYGAATPAATKAPPASIGRELLPGWEEDWLTDPRERLRLLQSQALETTAERLIAAGRPAEALPYALTAVQAQPWSESANRLLIEIHARRGDSSSALRRFHRFRDVLEQELGVQPGPDMLAVIRQLYPFGNVVDSPARPERPRPGGAA